jgi:hypothetical protein
VVVVGRLAAFAPRLAVAVQMGDFHRSLLPNTWAGPVARVASGSTATRVRMQRLGGWAPNLLRPIPRELS